ncbi:hypothetical protein [uncultured Tateyamaria sp.]|uniref:hypothetical protein n=1 Tax=uncultured Tateyamaria sp. TaxID=455651 RepID=UPI00261AFD24|nr:hypothetical protein [uncultured Tateyamaria sp.]
MRWDQCIANFGHEVADFAEDYFADTERKVLLIAGAGFDPRSKIVATCLVDAGTNIEAVLIKEIRPEPSQDLVDLAEDNKSDLENLLPDHDLVEIDIFGSDNAVVGGRNVVKALNALNYAGYTDVIVDISALSIGTSFPAIRYFIERIEANMPPANLHVFVTHNPSLDTGITLIPSDSPGYIHGFRGGTSLDSSSAAAKLWLPQLVSGRRAALNALHGYLEPHDTCPIVPFPAANPRQVDILAEEYIAELENAWSVDTRNLVYADESNPLDLYRTILRLHDLRRLVFQDIGGSLMILSPLGSKIMAIGALLAAMERNLPVAYLEAIGYNMRSGPPHGPADHKLVHLWLEGDVYPKPRPALQKNGSVK